MCGRPRGGKQNFLVSGLVGAAMCSTFWWGLTCPLAAVRGSGPGQQVAVEDAMALVGAIPTAGFAGSAYVRFVFPTSTSRRFFRRDRRDNAELGKVRSDRINHRGLLAKNTWRVR